MLNVWLVVFSDYDTNGKLTYRYVSGAMSTLEKARKEVRERAEGIEQYRKAEWVNTVRTDDSRVIRFAGGSTVLTVQRIEVK